MSLLASTSLGLESANTVHAEVRADRGLVDANYRLVVQTYHANNDTLTAQSRPVSSVQRAVTAQELREGVQVRLLELGSRSSQPLVVAWIEASGPDLEFDGRMARPRPGSIVGSARGNDDVHIRLTKRAA